MIHITKTFAIIGTTAALGLAAIQPAAAEGDFRGNNNPTYGYNAPAIGGVPGYLAGKYGYNGGRGNQGGGYGHDNGYHNGHGRMNGYYQSGRGGHGGDSYRGGYRGGQNNHGGYYKTGGRCTTVYKHDYWQGRYANIGGTQCYDHYGKPYIVPGSRYVIRYYY